MTQLWSGEVVFVSHFSDQTQICENEFPIERSLCFLCVQLCFRFSLPLPPSLSFVLLVCTNRPDKRRITNAWTLIQPVSQSIFELTFNLSCTLLLLLLLLRCDMIVAFSCKKKTLRALNVSGLMALDLALSITLSRTQHRNLNITIW